MPLSIPQSKKNEKSLKARFALILQGFDALRPRRKRHAPKKIFAPCCFFTRFSPTHGNRRTSGRADRAQPFTPCPSFAQCLQGFPHFGQAGRVLTLYARAQGVAKPTHEKPLILLSGLCKMPCPADFCFLLLSPSRAPDHTQPQPRPYRSRQAVRQCTHEQSQTQATHTRRATARRATLASHRTATAPGRPSRAPVAR